MSLEKEIKKARTEIVSDGYEMSVGEILNLYRDKEIIINPEFQRLFRWEESQKTRFIESLLLGIPIPPVFVYQDENGIWELIDGLQRLSTIFEFVGVLRTHDSSIAKPSVLSGTRLLPDLHNKSWQDGEPSGAKGIGAPHQLQIKRARIRVEILKQESDPRAKFELFQRLNTGGAQLSEQEVRNCVLVMLNKDFHSWIKACATNSQFRQTVAQTRVARRRQQEVELALRFFVFRNFKYQKGLDVHEYLDEGAIYLASKENFPYEKESEVFDKTFALLSDVLGSGAFKRWDGSAFKGKFLMSVFEVVATGVSWNLDEIMEMKKDRRKEFVEKRCKELWQNETFKGNSGAGVRGTTRLANLLPMAKSFFAPQ